MADLPIELTEANQKVLVAIQQSFTDFVNRTPEQQRADLVTQAERFVAEANAGERDDRVRSFMLASGYDEGDWPEFDASIADVRFEVVHATRDAVEIHANVLYARPVEAVFMTVAVEEPKVPSISEAADGSVVARCWQPGCCWRRLRPGVVRYRDPIQGFPSIRMPRARWEEAVVLAYRTHRRDGPCPQPEGYDLPQAAEAAP